MTMAPSQLVDVGVTRYYHCISRCVRRAMLCGEGFEHRKQWIGGGARSSADLTVPANSGSVDESAIALAERSREALFVLINSP